MFGPKIKVSFEKNGQNFDIELDRPLDEADAITKFVEWFGDNRVRQYLSPNFPIGASSEGEWLRNTSTDPDTIIWCVYTNGLLIGSISLMKIDRVNSRAELGISIGDKSYWGKGIAQVIEASLLSFAFENIVPGGLHKIYARSFAQNTRSIKALEKIGFQKIGLRKEQTWKNGQWHDEWLGEILNSEWQGQKEAVFAKIGIKGLDLYCGCEQTGGKK